MVDILITPYTCINKNKRKLKMSQEATLLHCYNRGCGKKFDPNDNKEGMLNI